MLPLALARQPTAPPRSPYLAAERGGIGGELASLLDHPRSSASDGIEKSRRFALQISEPHPVSQDVMHSIALIFSLSLSLPAPKLACDEVEATFAEALMSPSPIWNLKATWTFTDGIAGQIDYDLPDVGAVSIALRLDASGSGIAALAIDRAPLVDLQFVEWEFAGELRRSSSSASPKQAALIAASTMQIWSDESLELPGLGEDEERWKCWLAGAFAAATVGIVTVTSCGPCGATSALAAGAYVKDKCDKAQNKKDQK